jgi:hypothetical protein
MNKIIHIHIHFSTLLCMKAKAWLQGFLPTCQDLKLQVFLLQLRV